MPSFDITFCFFTLAWAAQINYFITINDDTILCQYMVFAVVHTIWKTYGSTIYQTTIGHRRSIIIWVHQYYLTVNPLWYCQCVSSTKFLTLCLSLANLYFPARYRYEFGCEFPCHRPVIGLGLPSSNTWFATIASSIRRGDSTIAFNLIHNMYAPANLRCNV